MCPDKTVPAIRAPRQFGFGGLPSERHYRRPSGLTFLSSRAASLQRDISEGQTMHSDQAVQADGGAPNRVRGVLQELSNEMVRIYKEIFGRGPTRVRADWAGPDAVLCTLEDSLTPAERKMVELGEDQR